MTFTGADRSWYLPHHENEIAQTESYSNGVPMARFWVHNGLLRLGEDKMSKSLGNIITAGEALQRFSSDALRLFFLSSHYRSPLTYSDQGVAAQERGAERLRNAAGTSGASAQETPLEVEAHRERFIAAMDDDLNTPRATAVLFDLAHDINRACEEGLDVGTAQDTLTELAGVLGLTLQEPQGKETADVAPLIGLLIEARADLRTAKRYDAADRVRQRLEDLGFALEDTPQGTEWKRRAR